MELTIREALEQGVTADFSKGINSDVHGAKISIESDVFTGNHPNNI